MMTRARRFLSAALLIALLTPLAAAPVRAGGTGRDRLLEAGAAPSARIEAIGYKRRRPPPPDCVEDAPPEDVNSCYYYYYYHPQGAYPYAPGVVVGPHGVSVGGPYGVNVGW
jgi:hypothetical protein